MDEPGGFFSFLSEVWLFRGEEIIQIFFCVQNLLPDEMVGKKIDCLLLRLSNCNITGQFGWSKPQRLPLTDLTAEALRAVEDLF